MGALEMYNLTAVEESITAYDFIKNMNDVSSGLLGILLLLAIFIIVFVAMKKSEEDFKTNLLVTSFITTIIAVLLWASEIIGWTIIIFPVILLLASIITYMFTQE